MKRFKVEDYLIGILFIGIGLLGFIAKLPALGFISGVLLFLYFYKK